MTLLLAINSFDREAYVRRWLDQVRDWAPDGRVTLL